MSESERLRGEVEDDDDEDADGNDGGRGVPYSVSLV